MRVFNHNGADITNFPIILGEKGRGRIYDEVRLDKRDPPENLNDIGFKTFTYNNCTHCVITKSTQQSGILVFISSSGCYTRGSLGSINVVCGNVSILSKGKGARGDAGRIGGWEDVFYHITSPSLFKLYIEGGEYKGCGLRYVLAHPKKNYVKTYKPDELIQNIVTDDDPIAADILKELKDNIPEELKTALNTSEELENTQLSSEVVKHYGLNSLKELDEVGWRAPANYEGKVDVALGLSRMLVPGQYRLAYVFIGSGGGKRYYSSVPVFSGVEILEQIKNEGHYKDINKYLCLIKDDNWSIEYDQFKDNKLEEHIFIKD